MTREHQPVTYFSRLDADECWALLADAEVGRIAWLGPDGINIVPVNFRTREGAIVFHTAHGTMLAALIDIGGALVVNLVEFTVVQNLYGRLAGPVGVTGYAVLVTITTALLGFVLMFTTPTWPAPTVAIAATTTRHHGRPSRPANGVNACCSAAAFLVRCAVQSGIWRS